MRITRGKAIRLKCLDCCCGQAHEVRLCSIRKCPLWNYRLGYEVDSEDKRVAQRKGSKNAFQDIEKEEEREANNDER